MDFRLDRNTSRFSILALPKFLDTPTVTFRTGNAQMLGTLMYMSPEQVTDASRVDKRSDIYAIGLILYEILTGYRPFRSANYALINEILNTPPPRFRERNPQLDVPCDIEQLVLQCLEKDPLRRPSSPRTLANEFRRLAAPRPVPTGNAAGQPEPGLRAPLRGLLPGRAPFLRSAKLAERTPDQT